MIFPVRTEKEQFKNNRRLYYLLQRDPHCYWCKREVFAYIVPPGVRKRPPEEATIDHLNDKIENGKRFNPNANLAKKQPPVETTVLACRECNEGRANEKVKSMSLEVLQARAGNPEENWANYAQKKNLPLGSDNV